VVVEQWAPPGLAVAVYVGLERPVAGDEVHETVALVSLANAAVTDEGAPATTPTRAAFDVADELPAAFVAITVKVYEVPSVKPVTTQEVVAVTQVAPPGAAVTTYPEIGAPLVLAGAAQRTVDWDSSKEEARTCWGGVGR